MMRGLLTKEVPPVSLISFLGHRHALFVITMLVFFSILQRSQALPTLRSLVMRLFPLCMCQFLFQDVWTWSGSLNMSVSLTFSIAPFVFSFRSTEVELTLTFVFFVCLFDCSVRQCELPRELRQLFPGDLFCIHRGLSQKGTQSMFLNGQCFWYLHFYLFSHPSEPLLPTSQLTEVPCHTLCRECRSRRGQQRSWDGWWHHWCRTWTWATQKMVRIEACIMKNQTHPGDWINLHFLLAPVFIW